MWCFICKKKFYIKRSFLTLFDTKTRFICDNCYNNNPINPKINMIQLDVEEIMVVSLLDTIYKVDMKPYAYEINQVYNYFMKNYFGYYIIFFLKIVNFMIFHLFFYSKMV